MSFEALNLHPKIFKAIQSCGYTKPTPIQQQAVPVILAGRDLMASAQTGTGKTAAFVLPALHHLSKQNSTKRTRILILTPTRELATQITKAASLYGKFSTFKVVSLVGGMSYHHQIKDLARGADIIVATPGRLLDHLENKRVELSGIDMLVFDEADRMLDMGFIDDVKQITQLTPSTRQTLLFSATLDERLIKNVRYMLKNPERIDLSNQRIAAPDIRQELYRAKNIQHKSRLLKHFLNDANIFKAIIFSATKVNANNLAYELRDQGFAAAALHGDLKQNVRNRTIEQLRSGKIQFLVATDVAARGIDIQDLTHVINFDLPKFCEDYVHRIGRTGRAGKSGVAISFVLPADTRHVQRIERYMGMRLKFMQDIILANTPDEAPKRPRFELPNDSYRQERKPERHRSRNFSANKGNQQTEFKDKPYRERKRPHFSDNDANQQGGFKDKPYRGRKKPRFAENDAQCNHAPKKKFFKKKYRSSNDVK